MNTRRETSPVLTDSKFAWPMVGAPSHAGRERWRGVFIADLEAVRSVSIVASEFGSDVVCSVSGWLGVGMVVLGG